MALRVRGTVVEVEVNSGSFDDGKTWETRHLLVSDGSSVERVKLAREMEAPAEGADVEVVVGMQLKQNPRNLLQPFRLDLIAVDVQNLTESGGEVPAQRRGPRAVAKAG